MDFKSILYKVITPGTFVVMNSLALIVSLLFLIQIIISGSKKLFQTKKAITIKSSPENQGFVVRTLIFLVLSDILLSISSITYSVWEIVGNVVPIFQPNEENATNIKSAYWIHLRVLRSLGLVGYAANYSSGAWTVCFAISLYLSLKSSNRPVRFRLIWEIIFHLSATCVSIAAFVFWFCYRNFSTEFLFFEKHKRWDGIIVGSFYSICSIVTFFQFFMDSLVCILIWRLASRSFKLIKGSNSLKTKKMRAAEWRLIFRLSLFLIPWLFLGTANILWYSILAYFGFFLDADFPIPYFVDNYVLLLSIIIPIKGMLNAFIYGFNAHRFDKKIVSCLRFIFRKKKKQIDEDSPVYHVQNEDDISVHEKTEEYISDEEIYGEKEYFVTKLTKNQEIDMDS